MVLKIGYFQWGSQAGLRGKQHSVIFHFNLRPLTSTSFPVSLSVIYLWLVATLSEMLAA